MNGYILEGHPSKVTPVLEELRQTEGIIIHNVFEQREDEDQRVTYIRVIFFAIDAEVASFIKLKYPADVSRPVSS